MHIGQSSRPQFLLFLGSDVLSSSPSVVPDHLHFKFGLVIVIVIVTSNVITGLIVKLIIIVENWYLCIGIQEHFMIRKRNLKIIEIERK